MPGSHKLHCTSASENTTQTEGGEKSDETEENEDRQETLGALEVAGRAVTWRQIENVQLQCTCSKFKLMAINFNNQKGPFQTVCRLEPFLPIGGCRGPPRPLALSVFLPYKCSERHIPNICHYTISLLLCCLCRSVLEYEGIVKPNISHH